LRAQQKALDQALDLIWVFELADRIAAKLRLRLLLEGINVM
jgi:hypothetical protein